MIKQLISALDIRIILKLICKITNMFMLRCLFTFSSCESSRDFVAYYPSLKILNTLTVYSITKDLKKKA